MRIASIFAPVLLGPALLLTVGTPVSAQSATAKVAAGAPVKAAVPVAAPLLPEVFAGWVAPGPVNALADPAQADPANAAALAEYSLSGAAVANYSRGSETLSLRTLRFHDASGAYGAYSFYRGSGWPKEKIGTGAASFHNRVLFWLGNTVVDATFSKITPMSGSELRELASQLPIPDGSRALAAPLLANLPQGSLQGQTMHYALGPAGYASGGVLPAQIVGFDRGAEAVTADYSLRSGPATLTLIDYPTPELAAAQETRIREYIKAGKQAQPAWTKALQDSDTASLEVRRSGPIVALVSGDAVPDDSHKLLETVHFEADLTAIPQPTDSEVKKTSKLLLGIAFFVIVGTSAMILLGFFLGGGRALYRIARGKPASSVFDEEFTSLHLRE